MATVALFGGSFNPPHVAHMLVAQYVLATCDVDALWLLPTYRHVFGKDLAPYSHRLAMCDALAAELGPRVTVSRAEFDLAQQPGFVASRMLDLLHLLRGQHPDHQFRLVIGGDILAETHKWYRWDDVAMLAPPIVIGRTGHVAPPGSMISEVAMPEISSTEIRRRLGCGDDVKWLLPQPVMRYIQAEGLYQ